MFLSFPQARELLLRQVINHLDNTAIGEGGDDLESAMGLDPDTYGYILSRGKSPHSAFIVKETRRHAP